jgi:hypothetical protein
MLTARIMRRMLLTMLVLGALVGGTAAPAFAAAPPGFAGVQGTVVEDGSGDPLAGVEVRLGSRSGSLALTDADGWFGFDDSVVTEGTTYDLYIEGDATHVGTIETVTFSVPGGTGDLGAVPLLSASLITGHITIDDGGATVPPVPLSGITVVALDGLGTPYFDALDETGVTGEFRIAAPPGEYTLFAFEDLGGLLEYDPQIYDGVSYILTLSGCGCADFDQVTSPSTGIDFALRAYDDWTWFSARMLHVNGNEFPDVEVRLYKLIAGDWRLVDQAITDDDGFADLFGFGDGKYRLSYYSPSGARLVGTTFDDYGYGDSKFVSSKKAVQFSDVLTAGSGGSTCGCRIVPFAGPDVDVTLTSAPSGPSTPVTPRVDRFGPPPTGLPNTTPTATPTPTPEPAPTETASPEPTSSPEPSESASPTPPPQDGVPVDLTWVWWLIALLLAGIAVLVVVLLRRR